MSPVVQRAALAQPTASHLAHLDGLHVAGSHVATAARIPYPPRRSGSAQVGGKGQAAGAAPAGGSRRRARKGKGKRGGIGVRKEREKKDPRSPPNKRSKLCARSGLALRGHALHPARSSCCSAQRKEAKRHGQTAHRPQMCRSRCREMKRACPDRVVVHSTSRIIITRHEDKLSHAWTWGMRRWAWTATWL
eukprot:scaffold8264_cov109-Isochrysis_galbana.AAC.11